MFQIPSRDVQINLVAHDRTGRGTRSAARNLDQLANKVKKSSAAKIDTKVNTSDANRAAGRLKQAFARAGDSSAGAFAKRFNAKAKTVFGKTGRRSGAAFLAGLLKAATFGQLGQGFAHAAIRSAPQFAAAGGFLGVALATALVAEITLALSALSSLIVGGALLAGPIAFLLVQQHKASKETQTQIKAVAALRKRVDNATTKDTKARLQKQLAAEERVLEELRKQSQQWDNLKAKAKSFMTFISAPLKLPLQKSLEVLFQGFNDLKGPVREFMAALGTALPGLTKGFMGFFLSFLASLKSSLPSIVLGLEEWGRVMPQIGAAVGDLLAQLASHPEAVQQFADAFTTDLGALGDVIAFLQDFAVAYANVNALLAGGRTNEFAAQWGKLGGVFRNVATVVLQSLLAVQTTLENFFQNLTDNLFPGPGKKLMQGFTDGIRAGRLKTEADLAAMQKKWNETDAAFKARKIKAKITADIAGLQTKLAEAKAKLKDPRLTKTKKIKILADIADLRLKIATGKAKLVALSKTKSKPKIQATINDLVSKVKTARARLKGVHNSKTRAKIKGDIAAALAKIRELRAKLKAIPDEQVNVIVKPSYANISKRSLAVMLKKNTADDSWGGSLNGGASSRTGGPAAVNVAAPNVDTRVFLDSREIRSVARSTVMDENRRNAYRARVGRR